jgi:hypothetical protein
MGRAENPALAVLGRSMHSASHVESAAILPG